MNGLLLSLTYALFLFTRTAYLQPGFVSKTKAEFRKVKEKGKGRITPSKMPRSTIGHSQSKIFYPFLGEDDEQRNVAQAEIKELTKHTGKNLKGYLPKDQVEEVKRIEAQEIIEKQAEAVKKDPTLPATLHGNRPARGAMVDKELMVEDEETLRRMEERKQRKKSLGHANTE
ncbi:hypothetical protein QBC47DRAFT_373225 [Echria macrotheca]|uniref:Uncharacterized protein n=1 Tax=Echria macrotheca TaxID=438768 RepID=A0AAJ0BKC8_9PEZI|nr:hypothetical protein QBC47DRAFT_373225 [Echria macrotheca]